jgi:hypothetical protein
MARPGMAAQRLREGTEFVRLLNRRARTGNKVLEVARSGPRGLVRGHQHRNHRSRGTQAMTGGQPAAVLRLASVPACRRIPARRCRRDDVSVELARVATRAGAGSGYVSSPCQAAGAIGWPRDDQIGHGRT